MGKPPGHEDEPRDHARADERDPDRAAILARRQRFIALALSGLATTTACDKPNEGPTKPNDGKEVQGGKDDGARPQPCLDVAVPSHDDGAGEGSSTGTPMPCLEVAPLPEPPPGPPPQACLKIAAPEPEPEPKPRPQPCLKVAPPKTDPEPKPKPQPCLRVAKPKDE